MKKVVILACFVVLIAAQPVEESQEDLVIQILYFDSLLSLQYLTVYAIYFRMKTPLFSEP